MTAIKTPTLDRMMEVKDQSQEIGSFLDWLSSEKKITLCEDRGQTCMMYHGKATYHSPIMTSFEELLAEYFEIDLKEADKEKRGLLASLRNREK